MKTVQASAEAIATKGWLASRKWLLARRATQLGILALFLLGPLAGIWFVKGNLNYSLHARPPAARRPVRAPAVAG